MAIDRWDPFREMLTMRDAMDRFFDDRFSFSRGTSSAMWAPRMDVMEDADEYRVRLAIPGVKPEDVQIQFEQNVLTVSGELKHEDVPNRRYLHQEHTSGPFSRSISLPAAIDADKASAQFEHGVLTVTLPKSEKARPRRIEIQTGGGRSAQVIAGQSTPAATEAAGEKSDQAGQPTSSGRR